MSEPKDQTEAACGGSALTAELGNPQQTHGFLVKGEDGSAKREVAIHLFDDGSYGIKFTTVWDGKAEPVITTLKLSSAGFSLFSEAIIEAALNMQNWPTPEVPNG